MTTLARRHMSRQGEDGHLGSWVVRVVLIGDDVSERLDFLEIQGDLAAQHTGLWISQGLGTATPSSLHNKGDKGLFFLLYLCHSSPCWTVSDCSSYLNGRGAKVLLLTKKKYIIFAFPLLTLRTSMSQGSLPLILCLIV